VKVAVLRKGRASSQFIWAAAQWRTISGPLRDPLIAADCGGAIRERTHA